MIIQPSKIKSEALLLFCRELIITYEKSEESFFSLSEEKKDFVDKQTMQLLKAINIVVQPNDYYLRNNQVVRISLILKSYQFLSNNLSRRLQNGDRFNPAMLCFALLCTWFAELSMSEDDKEFLYFFLYPYGEIYDKLLLNIDNQEYKQLNIKMVQIAEESIEKLHRYRFR